VTADDDLDDLTRIAEQAVGLGYDIVRNTTPAEVRLKGDRDLVTDVDLAVESQIRNFLGRMTPDIAFLGEEESSTAALDGDEDVWTLDPVDGTSNFAHGVPLYAVSLALVRDGEPVVASIVAPFLDLRYVATRGLGSFRNGTQLRVSKSANLAASIVSMGDYAVGSNASAKNQFRLGVTSLLAAHVERVRMFGSAALDLAWVAEGWTDAAVILGNKPWDTAAGVLIAREAGALVTDARGIRHNHSSKATIAMAPGISDALIALISSKQIWSQT